MSKERAKRGELPPAQTQIEKLEKVVTEGKYYGAQQMYKSMSTRYVSAQRNQEALDIVYSGACLQLQHGQVTCGAELAAIYVDILVKAKIPCSDEILGCLRTIYEAFPRDAVPQQLDADDDDDDMQKLSEALGAAKVRVEGCSSFLRAAIKWSADFGSRKSGSPKLHDMLAEYIYSESPEVDMNRVSYHFVRGSNPSKFASTLINFMGKCYPGEDDMAIARAVLMYLALGNMKDANYLIDELKKQVEATEDLEFPESDIIRFITYLLQTLERDALPLFKMLRQSYNSAINRDPSLIELLDEIAERFYGVRRRNPLGGMFGDIFKVVGGDMGL